MVAEGGFPFRLLRNRSVPNTFAFVHVYVDTSLEAGGIELTMSSTPMPTRMEGSSLDNAVKGTPAEAMESEMPKYFDGWGREAWLQWTPKLLFPC